MKMYALVWGVLLSVWGAACAPLPYAQTEQSPVAQTDIFSATFTCVQGADNGCREAVLLVAQKYFDEHPNDNFPSSDWANCVIYRDEETQKRGCSVVRSDLLLALQQVQQQQQEQQKQELAGAAGNLAEAIIVGLLSSLTYPKYAGRAYGVQQGINAGLSTWTGQAVPIQPYPSVPQAQFPVQCRWVGQTWTCY